MRQGRLYFVLILPDGSKSLIPASWTDFQATAAPPTDGPQLVGSLEDLLRLQSLADALLRRTVASTDLPAPSAANQESHAATESKLHRHPHPPVASLGTAGRGRKNKSSSRPWHASSSKQPEPTTGRSRPMTDPSKIKLHPYAAGSLDLCSPVDSVPSRTQPGIHRATVRPG